LQWDPSRPSRIVLVKRDVCGDREFGGFTGDAANSGFADQGVDPLALLPALPSFLPAAEWLLVGTLPLGSALSAEALRVGQGVEEVAGTLPGRARTVARRTDH